MNLSLPSRIFVTASAIGVLVLPTVALAAPPDNASPAEHSSAGGADAGEPGQSGKAPSGGSPGHTGAESGTGHDNEAPGHDDNDAPGHNKEGDDHNHGDADSTGGNNPDSKGGNNAGGKGSNNAGGKGSNNAGGKKTPDVIVDTETGNKTEDGTGDGVVTDGDETFVQEIIDPAETHRDRPAADDTGEADSAADDSTTDDTGTVVEAPVEGPAEVLGVSIERPATEATAPAAPAVDTDPGTDHGISASPVATAPATVPATQTAGVDTLAATGLNNTQLLLLAIACFALGGALVGLSRREQVLAGQ